jgi:hypothetical protein
VYQWTEHFSEDSLPDNARFLTDEMIEETIKDGRDCDRELAGRGQLRRKKTYEGVDAVLVLPEDKPYIITGWTEISDLATAAASDRWDMKQLETIQAFQDSHNPDFTPIRE